MASAAAPQMIAAPLDTPTTVMTEITFSSGYDELCWYYDVLADVACPLVSLLGLLLCLLQDAFRLV
jgi:hypothetical protein